MTRLPLSPVEAQSRLLELVNRLDGLRCPDPGVETIAGTEDGATVSVSVWHEPDVPVRTRLIELLRDAFPESEVISAPDIAA